MGGLEMWRRWRRAKVDTPEVAGVVNRIGDDMAVV